MDIVKTLETLRKIEVLTKQLICAQRGHEWLVIEVDKRLSAPQYTFFCPHCTLSYKVWDMDSIDGSIDKTNKYGLTDEEKQLIERTEVGAISEAGAA